MCSKISKITIEVVLVRIVVFIPKFLRSDACILTEMFQSSRNLDFTGGTFYSAENVQIGQCLD